MFKWLKALIAKVQEPLYADEGDHFCPVCGYKSLDREGGSIHIWSICAVCFWEDDDWFDGGGANHVTLAEARENFARYGAVEERLAQYVKPPFPDMPRIVPQPILSGESK